MSLLPCLERYSQAQDRPVTGAVIWLHGLGASGHDFEPLVPYLGLKSNVHFVFPNAPARPVTINMGMVMPSWYDIYSLGMLRSVSWEQVAESVAQVQALIERERERGIDPERIVLAGFSQGGAITLQLALTSPERFAGIMALSTYLFKPDEVPPASGSANGRTPLLMHHGRWDQTVPLALAELSQTALTKASYAVDWKTYPMEHGVCDTQIADIARWLQGIFDRPVDEP
ncbi:MAG: alpha/beta hydrolase [Candidatus Sericytochromatia bacterium]